MQSTHHNPDKPSKSAHPVDTQSPYASALPFSSPSTPFNNNQPPTSDKNGPQQSLGSPTSSYQDDQMVEKALLEDSFIEHGIVAVDKSVSILGEIINLSEGRDKLFKLLSAILKIARYVIRSYYPNTAWSQDILERIKSCGSATSTTRLFLKLFTDWVFFRLVIRICYKQRWGLLKIFTLVRLVGLGCYFTFQTPIWLSVTGLVKTIDRSFWSKLALRCYILSVCSQIFMDLRKVIDLTKEIGYWQLVMPTQTDFENRNHYLSQISQRLSNFLVTPDQSPLQSPQELESSSQPQKTICPTNPAAISFQERCTPTTMRYQALLRRTLLSHKLQQAVQSAQAPSTPNFQALPPPATSLSSLESLDATQSSRPLDHLTSPITSAIHLNEQQRLQQQHDALKYSLEQLQQEAQLAGIREGVLQRDRNKLLVNFIKDGGDLFGALDGLFDLGYSDLTLGVISFISASISLFRMWSRFKQKVEKDTLQQQTQELQQQNEKIVEQRLNFQEDQSFIASLPPLQPQARSDLTHLQHTPSSPIENQPQPASLTNHPVQQSETLHQRNVAQ